MTFNTRMAALFTVLVGSAACTPDQRDTTVDSAAGTAVTGTSTAGNAVQSALTIVNVDLGKHLQADRDVSDDTDTFAKRDSVYASVLTSGIEPEGQRSNIVGRWSFPDGTNVDQKAEGVAEGSNRLVFFLTRPNGLTAGKYTFRVLVDDREVRSKEFTVQ
jgi:hypothetical protein